MKKISKRRAVFIVVWLFLIFLLLGLIIMLKEPPGETESIKELMKDGVLHDKNKIRLFYKGIELLDDNLLFYDKIDNMAKIQCVISNVDKE